MLRSTDICRCLVVAILAGSASGCVVPTIITCVDPALADLLAPLSLERPPLTAMRLPAIEPEDSPVAQVAAPLIPATPLPLDAAPIVERSVLVRRIETERYAAIPREMHFPSGPVSSASQVAPAAPFPSPVQPEPPVELPLAMPNQPPLQFSAPPRIALSQIADQPLAGGGVGLATLQRVKPLRDISLNIAPPKIVNDQQQPIEPPHNDGAEALPLLASENPFTRGDLAIAGYEWHPEAQGLTFCYQPLYFEEVNLERYGRSFGLLQPFVSAAAFYGRIPALPYMAFARPARRCTAHAHWALPGYRLPNWEKQEFVPSITGSAAEVAALYGIILLIP